MDPITGAMRGDAEALRRYIDQRLVDYRFEVLADIPEFGDVADEFVSDVERYLEEQR
jgi:hypothetical protein